LFWERQRVRQQASHLACDAFKGKIVSRFVRDLTPEAECTYLMISVRPVFVILNIGYLEDWIPYYSRFAP
jgi:hypothetical protein